MLTTSNDTTQRNGHGARKRFTCMTAGQSSATELLRSCPVVTAAGQAMGQVRTVLVDARSRQLRFVTVISNNSKGTVTIPWQALYFDSDLVRLVYYTFS
jgi:PRC-barrel domain